MRSVVWWSKGQGQRPWLATPVSVALLAAGIGLLVAAFVKGE